MVEKNLSRQLRQLDLAEHLSPTLEQWKKFLTVVNRSYESNREARYLLETALEESSREMTQLNKELAEEAEQRVNAIKESEEKSRFMETMSHELRTPIHGILGSLEIIKDNTNLDPKQKKFISTALVSGENLLDIVNNILDFSKIKADELELESLSFNVREIFTDISQLISTMASDKKLDFITDIEDNVPKRVKGDPGKLRQILMILANNAVKFTQIGSVIAEIKLLDSDSSQTYLRFEVTDTGVGIPQSKVEGVFRAFMQADNSTTRQFEGVGLGLTICRELVHLMDGTINLESIEGKGSHFWIDIPFETIDAIDNNQVVLQSDDLSGLKVLIVEKDKANLSIFDHYFSMWDVHYTLVDNTRDAIEALYLSKDRNAIYDVVMIDYFMPGRFSLELSEILNSHKDFKHIPKVTLSSYNLAKEEREIANIAICLTKPIRETMLKDVLLECLNIRNAHLDNKKDEAIGTRFTHQNQVESNSALFKKDILLAEDNPVNALIAVTMMEQIGLSVQHVTDGQQALNEVKNERYKLVLMDMHMPIMDGYKATESIRDWEQQQQSNRIPIIALTANALAGDREKCLSVGMDDYLPKPVKQDLLQEVVKRWATSQVAA